MEETSTPVMTVRYTPDELKLLRDSPLVVKPQGLPPQEQWMGPPADSTHQTRTTRPAPERHVSRNSANPEDIILGPPKTSFMSATSIRNPKTFDSTDRPSLRDLDSKERFSFRSKATEIENERRANRGDTLRPKRADGEDSDGWSTVKPRKSFGTEGAERFNGRMGGADRHRDDRRFKGEEREVKDRPRTFDRFARDKDGDQDQEQDTRRNGTGRGRNESSWFKTQDRDNDGPLTPRDRNNGDRTADRSRGWREKEREDRGDRGDRGADRGERRWDRDNNRADNRGDNPNRGDHRQEREPEWMDEPASDKNQAHTQDDFQKWKEQMAAKDKPSKPTVEDTPPKDNGSSFFNLEKSKVETPLEIDTGPDKFFGMWAPTPKEDFTPDSAIESRKEGMPKAKAVGKASRFTSFFAQEEPIRRQTEPPTTLPQPQPQAQLGGLASLFQASPSQSQGGNTSDAQEKEAFQALLLKLQLQKAGGSGSTPPANTAQQPKPPPEKRPVQPSNEEPSQEPYLYRSARQRSEPQDEIAANIRSSQQQQQQLQQQQLQQQQQAAIQEMFGQRQISNSQPSVRPEQMLQDLVGQRQNALSQASARQDQQPQSRNTNTEFLMGLMQSAKAAPEPQRTEQILLRMPPKMSIMDRQLQQQQLLMEREQELHREAQAQAHRERAASASQRQARPPPGFYDDPSAFQRGPPQHERQSNPQQPTQILQRPPPPGLDLGWDRQAQLPPQHRLAQNIAPPPGLNGGRGIQPMPLNQQMFPPGFMGNFAPPEVNVMSGPPRGMQMQPPPGFFNGPPPGFLPPGMSAQGFNAGLEGMGFSPYDGRGGVPPGYRRQ